MENSLRNIDIFSGRANRSFADGISEELGIALGKTECFDFSDGEIFFKFCKNIRGREVFLIQPTFAPAENLMELLIMLDAAKRASARQVTAVIPYFGYARQDRKDQPRVSISAKMVANLITKAGADRVLTMDLHSPQIQGFFDIPFDHLYSAPVLCDYFRSKENLTVVSPDIGGVKLARAYAKRLGADLAIIDKRRPAANKSEVMNIIGAVKGKNILIIDDLIDTAGTITKGAVALKENGAEDIFVACTHPVFSGDAIERIEKSPIKSVTVTDTIPMRHTSGKIEVATVAKLFGEAIRRIYNSESISVLFDSSKTKSNKGR